MLDGPGKGEEQMAPVGHAMDRRISRHASGDGDVHRTIELKALVHPVSAINSLVPGQSGEVVNRMVQAPAWKQRDLSFST